ncbi:MAG TPA: hypothetical protein VFM24_08250 [Nitrospira sp.]|nr:hypothetical protein [Nitrospira sp.]
MTSRSLRCLAAVAVLTAAACAGQLVPHEPDVIDVTLAAPTDQVRAAVVRVLTDGGYDVEQEDEQNFSTGYRQEIRSPWDGLLRWRFGTGRSRVNAVVTAADDLNTRLRLHVHYEGKDGLFTRWEESPTALPQSAENQLRLIKNALQLL